MIRAASFAAVIVLQAGAVLAQERPAYCPIPERSSADTLNVIIHHCRPGDLIGIPADNPEWVARICDLSKPTTPTGRFVVCHLAASIGPYKGVPGSSSLLREQVIRPR